MKYKIKKFESLNQNIIDILIGDIKKQPLEYNLDKIENYILNMLDFKFIELLDNFIVNKTEIDKIKLNFISIKFAGSKDSTRKCIYY